MEISNVWITFVLTWSISSIQCNSTTSLLHPSNNGSTHYAEFIRYDADVEPITHLEMIKNTIEAEKEYRRIPRDSYRTFDEGYDEFLRNYRNDNDQNGYKVTESAEQKSESAEDRGDAESNEDDSTEESGGDESEQDQSESEEQVTKKSFNAAKPSSNKNNNRKNENKHNGNKNNRRKEPTKSDDDYDRVRDQANKKKKSKYCKNEKRGNMLCNVCHNPKNDENSESCSFNSDAKDKKAYSKDKKYGTSKDDDRSDSESSENDKEFTTRRPIQPPMQYRPRYPQTAPRQFLPPNVPSYQNTPQFRRNPRLQSNIPPSVSLIRYRSISTPGGVQRIRIFTYPPTPAVASAPIQLSPQANAQYYNRRPYPYYNQDFRQPRDINGGKMSESLFSNVTKQHEFETLPDYLTNREYADFMNKDWSKCVRSFEDRIVCYVCQSVGGTSKECMFINGVRPDNYYESYSTLKTFDKKAPYAFDLPPQQQQKQNQQHIHRKPKLHPGWNGQSTSDDDDKSDKSDESRNNSNDSDNDDDDKESKMRDSRISGIQHRKKKKNFHHNNQPEPQRLKVPEIIYGKPKSEVQPQALGLFYKVEPGKHVDSNRGKNSTKSI